MKEVYISCFALEMMPFFPLTFYFQFCMYERDPQQDFAMLCFEWRDILGIYC